jgi:hypothetical protein
VHLSLPHLTWSPPPHPCRPAHVGSAPLCMAHFLEGSHTEMRSLACDGRNGYQASFQAAKAEVGNVRSSEPAISGMAELVRRLP